MRIAFVGGINYFLLSGDWSDYYSDGLDVMGGIKLSIPKDYLYIHIDFHYSTHTQESYFSADQTGGLNDLKIYSLVSGMILNIPISSTVVPFAKIDIGTTKISAGNPDYIEDRWTSCLGFGGGVEIFPGTDRVSFTISSTLNVIPIKINFNEDEESGLFYRYGFGGTFNYYLY